MTNREKEEWLDRHGHLRFYYPNPGADTNIYWSPGYNPAREWDTLARSRHEAIDQMYSQIKQRLYDAINNPNDILWIK